MKLTSRQTTQKKIYLNKAQEMVNLIRPWSLYAIIGRGSGKSTRILALRSQHAVFEMPGSCLCFFGSSYINLASNLVPQIISGWKELGYVEGWDYVVGQCPPPHFKPLQSPAPDNWKHTVTWANGTIFHLGSSDRLSNILSRSFQHFFGDEARIIDYEKVSQSAFPTIRGERIKFGKCPMYGGFSFTSDMPDPEIGQWLLEKENVMDVEQIQLIFLLSLEENKILLELSNPDIASDVDALRSDLKFIREELAELRQQSVHFLEGSSLVNIDALGENYIDTMYQTLTWSTFKSSILNIQSPDIEKMFYYKFGPHIIISPSFNYNLLDKLDMRSYVHNSRADLHIDHDKELYAGMDFGNMNSMAISQKYPHEFRTVKNLHVLQPKIIDDLADDFCDYFRLHGNKKLYIDYDRAGNNRMPNSNKTVIQQFVDRIRSKQHGWIVFPRSINMRNIPHKEKRALVNRMMGGMIENAPALTIVDVSCKELINSIKISKTKPGTDDEKDKSSEKKRNLQMLPMYSTNYSDAYDYSVWGNFSHLIRKSSAGSLGASMS